MRLRENPQGSGREAGKVRDALAKADNVTYYPDIKLKDYLGRWLEGSVREKTYERYESVSRVHIVPELGDRTLASLHGSPGKTQDPSGGREGYLVPGSQPGVPQYGR